MLEIGKIFIKNGIHYCQVQYKDKKREEILTYIDMQIMRPDLLFKYFDKACPSKPLWSTLIAYVINAYCLRYLCWLPKIFMLIAYVI